MTIAYDFATILCIIDHPSKFCCSMIVTQESLEILTKFHFLHANDNTRCRADADAGIVISAIGPAFGAGPTPTPPNG